VDVDRPGIGTEKEWATLKNYPEPFTDCAKQHLATPSIMHFNNNFVTLVVFQGERMKPPERISKKQIYASVFDIGYNTKNQATFLLDPPNDAKGSNEFYFGRQLGLSPDSIGLPQPRILSAERWIDGKKADPPGELPYDGKVTIIVEGEGLAGNFSMVERASPQLTETVLFTDVTRVFENDKIKEYSDLKKVEVTFCMKAPRRELKESPLRPSPFPYTLKFTNLLGHTTEYDGIEFKTTRRPRDGNRSFCIESLSPENGIRVKNLSNETKSLKGWQILAFNWGNYMPLTYVIGNVLVAPNEEVPINPGGIFDRDGTGSRVYLVHNDGTTVEDFVGYLISKENKGPDRFEFGC
jgi:hypothetical protein